jgi:hypothetical protein
MRDLKGRRKECIFGEECRSLVCTNNCKQFQSGIVARREAREKNKKSKELRKALEWTVKKYKARLFYNEDSGECEIRFNDGKRFKCSGPIVDEAFKLMRMDQYES